MDIKTQTTRATNFKRDLKNINIFVNKSFEFGIVTSKYWGDFDERKEPLIEIEANNKRYNLPLSEFLKFINQKLTKWKDWDYTENETKN